MLHKSVFAADDSGPNPATTRLKFQARFAVCISEGTVSVEATGIHLISSCGPRILHHYFLRRIIS